MKLIDRWLKRITKNYTEIPLLWITFDYQKYQKDKKNSCTVSLHPDIRADIELQEKINNLIDYIRDNYDMSKFIKF